MHEISMSIDGIINLESGGISDAELFDGLKMIKDAGFDYIDWGLYFTEYENSIPWAERFAEVCEKTGIKIGQTHTAILGFVNTEEEPVALKMVDFGKERLEFSFKAANIWGCKNTVIHPLSHGPVRDEKYRLKTRQINIEYFKHALEYAYKYDVNICIETMPQKGSYGDTPIELKDLHDTLNDEKIKYCVDTGHVHMSKIDVAETIEFLGRDIGVLHLQDTMSGCDNHCLPPFGTIDWKAVCRALAKVKYEGLLNFEIHGGRLGTLDIEAKKAYLTYCAEMGKYVKRLIESADISEHSL